VKVPVPATAVPASYAPQTPAVIVANERDSALVAMPMFASEYCVSPDTVTVPDVLFDVGDAPVATVPYTVTAPPVGTAVSTMTVTCFVATRPKAFVPVRSYR
jgi:hypothetical protein